jgi:hypothetical protein
MKHTSERDALRPGTRQGGAVYDETRNRDRELTVKLIRIGGLCGFDRKAHRGTVPQVWTGKAA